MDDCSDWFEYQAAQRHQYKFDSAVSGALREFLLPLVGMVAKLFDSGTAVFATEQRDLPCMD